MDLGEFYQCLNVKSLKVSLDFYLKLGFSKVADHSDENWAVIKHNNLYLCLYQGHIRRNLMNFRGGDISQITKIAEENGLTFSQKAILHEDGSWSAEIDDPDGNCIYLNTYPAEMEAYLKEGTVITEQ